MHFKYGLFAFILFVFAAGAVLAWAVHRWGKAKNIIEITVYLCIAICILILGYPMCLSDVKEPISVDWGFLDKYTFNHNVNSLQELNDALKANYKGKEYHVSYSVLGYQELLKLRAETNKDQATSIEIQAFYSNDAVRLFRELQLFDRPEIQEMGSRSDNNYYSTYFIRARYNKRYTLNDLGSRKILLQRKNVIVKIEDTGNVIKGIAGRKDVVEFIGAELSKSQAN